MVISAGIGVLIGLGLGAGIVAFLMQRVIRRQDNALKQSFERLNRIQEEQAQELNEAVARMEADYERQLAAKIELYQDSHEAELTELEAEYEARLAALTAVAEQDLEDEAIAYPETAPPETIVTQPSDVFKPIPDPWTDLGESSGVTTKPAPDSKTAEPAPDSTTAVNDVTPPPPAPQPAAPTPLQTDTAPPQLDTQLAADVVELGKAAAINPKAAIRAIPQLGKLTKNPNPDVRLAAVTALQESGSIKAIPFLRQALRDTDSRIVAVASAALGRFKGVKKPTKKVKTSKKKRRR